MGGVLRTPVGKLFRNGSRTHASGKAVILFLRKTVSSARQILYNGGGFTRRTCRLKGRDMLRLPWDSAPWFAYQ